MVKLICSLFISCLCLTLSAQSYRFGPVMYMGANISEETKSNIVCSLGAKCELYFSNDFKGCYADASILFHNSNRSSESYYYVNEQISRQWKYSTISLSIPVSFGYKLRISNKLELFSAFGPYVDFGLAGVCRVVSNDIYGNSTNDKASSNVFKDEIFNRVDAGLHVKCGIELCSHYQLCFRYIRGLTQMFNESVGIHSQEITLGLSYVF